MAHAPNNRQSKAQRTIMAALGVVALAALCLGISLGQGMATLAIPLCGMLVCLCCSAALTLSRHMDGEAPLTAEKENRSHRKSAQNADDAAIVVVPAAELVEDEDDEIDIAPSLSGLEPWEDVSPIPHTLDLGALSERLVKSADPVAELKLFVSDIRERVGAEEVDVAPSPFERYAERLLVEAGLFRDDVELPSLRIVRPPASGMFYLRIADRQLPYLAKVRVLAIESALNALRFSDRYFDDPDDHPIEEHYQLIQRLTHSIAAQSPSLPENVPVVEDDDPDTEWAVRMGISTAIESFQLPHRLVAKWRVNVADGNVGIEVELTPEAVFPNTRYVEDLGLVTASREMRRKAASDYALRLALLVAAAAFRTSEKILHVWVAGNVETATRHACYLSVDFDRWRFARLDLSNLGSLSEVYRSFAPTLRYEEGILRPVAQSFSLEEHRFCPPRRYEAVALSTRKLARPLAEALGTERVSGLAIDEATNRELVASDIMRRLDESTEHNVHLILELAGDDPDPTVRGAAERTVSKLIEGSLAEDAQSVGEEFVWGDALSRAVGQASKLLAQRSPDAAERVLTQALGPVDEAGIYADTPYLEHRFFTSYVERALYNHLFAPDGRLPVLVPFAYFQAHLLISFAQLVQGKFEPALAHARRVVELAPLDARSYIHLTRCLEATGDIEGAMATLRHLLGIAHDPEGIALAYYRMAFFQWGQGNYLAAQACYAFALRFMPAFAPIVAMELSTLAFQVPGTLHEDLSEEEAERILREGDIPVAPTDEMSEAFLSCAKASLNAEVFPVARNFAWILGAFSRDDIVTGFIRSIEDAPDQ